ncbi:hypothetical protein KXS12_21255 [Priestia filamentosa]|uniref:lanthionine synthetase LanC family protein n=1 Tax=Priestia filamentosa TaxID=1402861 RepID=UPI003F136DF4
MENQIRPLFHDPKPEDYLKGAEATAQWLRNTVIKTPDGFYWPEQPLDKSNNSTFLGEFSLYSGTTGIIYFFIQIAKATYNDTYLEEAIEGGRYIINNWSNGSELQLYRDKSNSQWCMINGVSGVAFVLTELAIASGRSEFRDFSIRLIDQLVNSAIETKEGVLWTGEPGVIFDSGIILFLIYASKKYNRKDWYELAVRASEKVLKQGQASSCSGMSWPNISATHFGLPEDSIIPNYFYGTSGIAYTMAVLYEESQNEKFLEGAKEGANYIKSISTIEGDSILVPYSLPHLKHVHYIGLCHGAVGTIRLFYKLFKLTGDPQYKEWMDSIVRGVINTGAPELHSEGYWNTTCQCCGSAGLSNLFLGLWAETKEEIYLSYAKRVGKHLLSESTYDHEKGACWYQAWERLEPWKIAAKTGYFDGAAGNASELIHIYQASINQFDVLRLPDDPYPTKA